MKLCKPLRATTKWLRHAVAGKLYTRPLCPFASKPLRSELIRLVSCDSECEEQLMSLLKQELNCLFPVTRQSSETSPATTLVVAPNLFHNNYRAMVHFSWRIMEYISTQAAYAEQVQVSLYLLVHHSLASLLKCCATLIGCEFSPKSCPLLVSAGGW